MSTSILEMTLGDLVASRPELAPLLESLHVDYCCGGQRTLAEAARERGLDASTLASVLAALPPSFPVSAAPSPASLDTPDLVDHIVSRHHQYVRSALPRLVNWSTAVAQAHGKEHPSVVALASSVQLLSQTLLAHLKDEEEVLFPAVLSGQSAREHSSLKSLEEDHEEAGSLLASLRQQTSDWAHTSWGCTTFHLLMDGLRDFELDLHQHVHLENNVLFRR